jgi:hypothetical protein
VRVVDRMDAGTLSSISMSGDEPDRQGHRPGCGPPDGRAVGVAGKLLGIRTFSREDKSRGWIGR